MKYKIAFNFPYGKTWLKSTFSPSDANRVIYPEFTSAFDAAMMFDNKFAAEQEAKFYAGKYSYEIVQVD